jgi:predicted phage terminase large subunit-like protein
LTPRLTKWIPIDPHPKQTIFLLAPQLEILFGGAAGGGKSEGLLAGFAQYADVPTYKGIIFRRTFRDLDLPGALMDRSHQWWDNTTAKWSSSKYSWTFPSGAILQFGYLERDTDKYRYQSAEFQYIGFDELTQFTEDQYTYLFSRLRRLNDDALAKMGIYTPPPIRMRAATNPGGVGHDWVKRRFIGSKTRPVREENRLYIPSGLDDNPSLDQEAYERSLEELDPITRRQLRLGDWDADGRGGLFETQWFNRVTDPPRQYKHLVRYWDLAATDAKAGKDPDYTVGVLLGLDDDNNFWVLDVKRFRKSAKQVENTMRNVADMDGVGVPIFQEQEPGASGKWQIDHIRREVLFGYSFRGLKTTGSKAIRAEPVASAAEGGLYNVKVAGWNEALFDELANFPEGAHDDQVDALSGAHTVITRLVERGKKRNKARQSSGFREYRPRRARR